MPLIVKVIYVFVEIFKNSEKYEEKNFINITLHECMQAHLLSCVWTLGPYGL